MTLSELAFLALGALLGSLGGIGWAVARGRHDPRRIRVTVTPGAIPARRRTTLVPDSFGTASGEPARGGPADRRARDRDLRTDVQVAAPGAPAREPVPISIRPDGSPSLETLRAAMALAADRAMRAAAGGSMAGTLVIGGAGGSSLGAAGITTWRDALRAASENRPTERRRETPAERTTLAEADPPTSLTAKAQDPHAATDRPASPDPSPDPATDPLGETLALGVADACAAERRQLSERCAVAARARDEATRVGDALRGAQREYDDHLRNAASAEAILDPRAMRAAKDGAQQAFHEARAAAHSPIEAEDAARVWLGEINRINNGAREAATLIDRANTAARALVALLERRAVEADATRIAAETAELACTDARQLLATCEERGDSGHPLPTGRAPRLIPTGDAAPALELAAAVAGGEPVILRLLRGERAAIGPIAAELGAGDEAAAARWAGAIGQLLDAIIARAVETSILDFPAHDPFWEPFSLTQAREIAAALASLGYRFDGQGGWIDDRLPSQRDLSMAIGYAGLDPMRIRNWPSEADTADLYRAVRVAADEYLIEAAGDLTLADLIGLLGRRADPLTELWNAWGRIRPLLLAPAEGPDEPPPASSAELG